MKIFDQETDVQPIIIAEVGNNHEGSVNVARELIAAAKSSGAQVVKFQVFKTENFLNKSVGTERYEKLRSFELTYSEFEALKNYCDKLDIKFLATPFDIESAKFLKNLQSVFKVASSDNDYWRLMKSILATGSQLICSTGLIDDMAVKHLHARFVEMGVIDRVVLMHCVSAYPAKLSDLNLRHLKKMIDHFECTIGYSDHSLGIDACKIALSLGARVIEKHFTLDKNYSTFRDHSLSAEPEELAELVRFSKSIDIALGSELKPVSSEEKQASMSLRRGLYAARNINAGDHLMIEDVIELRPLVKSGNSKLKEMVGTKITRNILKGEEL